VTVDKTIFHKPTIHDLRRTFAILAESLDLSPFALKALLNHSQPDDDVTGGYIKIRTERLRDPMQKITDALLQIVNGDDAKVVAMPQREQTAS
jgi:hypothetical protein